MSGHLALVVDQPGATLEPGTHDTVVLRYKDGRCERVGLRALGSVVLHGDVKLSTGLLRMLAAQNVALAVIARNTRAASAGFAQLPHRHAERRHQQHLSHADAPRRLELARLAVGAKLDAMAEFARRHMPGAADDMYRAMHAAAQTESMAALMGVEGAASARHFGLLQEAYRAEREFHFSGRTRQPPADPPNALMSLAYTLAQAEAAQLVLRSGLDVQIGFLHGIHRDRQSLALDLLEPARPVLDDWVHELLVRRRVIAPGMFARSEHGPSWLTKEGRAAFYPLWFQEGYRVALPPMRSLLARLLAALRRVPA
jgi:CRISP-associated protein Cas1